MPLQRFKLPAPESRLVTHKGVIFKIKLAYKYVKANAFLPCPPGIMQKEVEATLRTVLHKDNRIEPLKIKTAHFLIDCEMKPWATVKQIRFEENDEEVPAYPDMIVLTVQPKPGRRSSAAYQPISNAYRQKGRTEDEGTEDNWDGNINNASPDVPAKTNVAKSSKSPENKGKDNAVTLATQSSARFDDRDDNTLLSASPSKYNTEKQLLGQNSVSTRSGSCSKSANGIQGKYSPTVVLTDIMSQVEVRNNRSRKQKVQDVLKQPTKKGDTKDDIDDDESSPVCNTRELRSRRRQNMVKDDDSKSESTPPNKKSNKIRTLHKVPNVTETESTGHMQSRKAELRNRRQKSKGRNIRNTRSRKYVDSDSSSDSSENVSEKSERKQEKPTLRNRPVRSSQSASPSSKTHTRLKSRRSAEMVRKSDSQLSESPVSQPSNESSSRRASKRLKTRVLKDLPPTKKARLNENADNNNSRKTRLSSVGTQTQVSTYRIKNADVNFLKKSVLSQNTVDDSHSGRRPRRVLRSHPSTGDDFSTRSTNREALCYKRDRTLIQQEELEEEMKLQQMATFEPTCDKRVTRKQLNKRRSLISRLGDIITPVKKLFRKSF